MVRNFDETRVSPTSSAGCSARHRKMALLSDLDTGNVSREIDVHVRALPEVTSSSAEVDFPLFTDTIKLFPSVGNGYPAVFATVTGNRVL